jgi:hypothetical protein
MSQNSGRNQPPSSSDSGGGSSATSAVAAAAPGTSSSSSTSSSGSSFRMPSHLCMQHAAKLGIVEDRPIMLDYWTLSLEKKVIIGVKENGEKLLVKSEDEYTSPVSKIFKIEAEYIILTENSIYIVSSDIQSNRIN